MERRGLFTLADVIGMIIVLFVFGVFSPILMDAVVASWNASGVLTKALIAIIIPAILIGFLKAVFELQATRRVQEAGRVSVERRRAQQSLRRRRRQ